MWQCHVCQASTHNVSNEEVGPLLLFFLPSPRHLAPFAVILRANEFMICRGLKGSPLADCSKKVHHWQIAVNYLQIYLPDNAIQNMQQLASYPLSSRSRSSDRLSSQFRLHMMPASSAALVQRTCKNKGNPQSHPNRKGSSHLHFAYDGTRRNPRKHLVKPKQDETTAFLLYKIPQ
jgi:hypothetical protein